MKEKETKGVDTSNGTVSQRKVKGVDKTVTSVEPKNGTIVEKLRRSPQKKYRHVAAVHSQTRPSCLSHDAVTAPSFIGFRNLMVIVLGKSSSPKVAAFVIDNWQWWETCG